MKRRAFTLVELAFVLIILGMLLALIGTALSKSRQRAEQVRKQVWVRQWIDRNLINGWINARQYQEQMEWYRRSFGR